MIADRSSSMEDRLRPSEQTVAATACEPAVVIIREHIILVWPNDLKPQWYAESQVRNPLEMADWLETAFRFSARWTRFDPNDHYARRNGENIRLIFVHNGSFDFNFGGKRPFIGLRDLKKPLAGSEDWFGWLAHELSHDFWHEHPAFQRVKDVWGEGMCDYERYSLLLNMGMPEAARHWNQLLQDAHLDDRYRAGAWMFLRFQRSHSLDGPAALWEYLWDKDFDAILGKPRWIK
ncbi:MAG: hypothetical protein ABSA47_09885 [Verrucomicrobiota bacterium]